MDLTRIKKEYIPSGDVPRGRMTNIPWDKIFSEIPKGQALVLHEPEIPASTVWVALKREHKQGRFKNLRFSTKGMHGSARIYITDITSNTHNTHKQVT